MNKKDMQQYSEKKQIKKKMVLEKRGKGNKEDKGKETSWNGITEREDGRRKIDEVVYFDWTEYENGMESQL